MRTVLNSEIRKERCNAAALGAYNASVGVGDNNLFIELNNSDLKNRTPRNGEIIMLPNYRIEVIANEKDGSFSKSKIMNRNDFKELSYFFDRVPVFIKKYLNNY